MEEEELFLAYADVLLGQMPCFRMNQQHPEEIELYLDPNLKGIIYHTIKFCDYYGFEYASIKKNIKVPLLKIETDFTSQSAGQLLTQNSGIFRRQLKDQKIWIREKASARRQERR